jgi:uncharacterized membrane protein
MRRVDLLGVPVVVWLAAAAYAALVGAASVARHYAIRSGGYDLGIFDQAVWLLGHGHEPFSTIRGRNLFADHFQPALVLLAPLGALGLTPAALLVLQALLLAAASPVLYALARARGASEGLALAVAVLWLASPLTQWANLFDWHPETAVPVLLALGALQLERGRRWGFVVTAVVASSVKEDVCLVYFMWGLVLAAGGLRRFGLAIAGAAAVWFVLATQTVRAFGGNFDYYSTRFGGERGSSLGAVFRTLAQHPSATVSDAATAANLKILIALVVCSGGLALLAPRMLLPALPSLLANVLSAYTYQHDLHFQYQLVPAAVFAVASAYGAGTLTRRVAPRTQRLVAGVLVAGAAVVTVAAAPAVKELRIDARASPLRAAKKHALSLIPASVPVAAAPELAPHLAHRREIYQLPEPYFPRPSNGEYWSDAQLARRAQHVRYVAYSLDVLDPYPRLQVERVPARLRRAGFVEIFSSNGVKVFRRQ